QFVEILRRYKDSAKTVSILTFNYDVCVDFALFTVGLSPDYGLDLFKPPPNLVPLFKLHGSLNWANCGQCKDVVPWSVADYARDQYQQHAGEDSIRLNVSAHLSERRHDRCHRPLGNEPVIVPPTWNKAEYHQQIERVWIRAARELSDAENIFVCGYSLPE